MSKSKFVYVAPNYRQETELGFLPAIPLLASAAGGSGGAGAIGEQARAIVGKIGSILSGPDKDDKDETHSKSVNTITEALLNMNRLDDSAKARQIAITAVQMGVDGKSFNEVGKYIDSSAGYAPEGPYLPSDGALYPWGQIYRHWQRGVEAGGIQNSSGSMMASATTAGVAKAGVGKYVLIGGGVLLVGGLVAALAK